MTDFMTVVALLAAAILAMGGWWVLYETKPMRLRSADGKSVPTAKDEQGILAIFDLTVDPGNRSAAAALQNARAEGRVRDFEVGTRVRVINRKFYKNGRLRQQLSIRAKAENPEDENLGSKVEWVHLVDTQHAGLEVWVAEKYCKKSILPF